MPFLKFFNYGESNGADVDWSKPVRVMDKGVCATQHVISLFSFCSHQSALGSPFVCLRWAPIVQSTAAYPRCTTTRATGTFLRRADPMAAGTCGAALVCAAVRVRVRASEQRVTLRVSNDDRVVYRTDRSDPNRKLFRDLFWQTWKAMNYALPDVRALPDFGPAKSPIIIHFSLLLIF
jgi:hypothetical protein